MAVGSKSPDYIIFFTVIALLGLGVVMVYSSSAISAYVNFGDSYYFFQATNYLGYFRYIGDAVYHER